MADLAIGLSKTVVEGALNKVQSAIEEDVKLRKKAQRDLVAITLEFEMMQSFLDVAKEESVTNSMVKTWVRHVRELAYDLEDCVEFVVHLDNTPDWWRRLLPSCVAPQLPLDQAVQELEELKRRVEDVNNCYRRYSNIGDSGTSSKLVMLQQPASSTTMDAYALNRIIEAREAAKRRQGLCDLTKLITDIGHEDDLQVIGIWGTGGDLRMSASVLWKAYSEIQTCQNFGCRAWVKLMHPFNPHDFLHSLIGEFYASTSLQQKGAIVAQEVLKRMNSNSTQEDLVEELAHLVNEQRYLVVLEDLSSMAEWGAIRMFFPYVKNGSCIVVSMQQFTIASLCIGHPYQLLELEQFSADHSVYAFIKKGSESDENFDDVSINTSKNRAAEDWMLKHTLFGRKSEMDDLRRFTKSSKHVTVVISVWGIVGVGKSALVKNFFCERIRTDCNQYEKIYKRPFEKYGWVDVSHPFGLRGLAGSLILNFHSRSLEAKGITRSHIGGSRNPILECQRILKQHRCLIVIDGLQSKKEWDMIQAYLVSGSSRNCIIVITTEASIAKHCSKDRGDLVLNVKALEDNELLKMEVSPFNQNSEDVSISAGKISAAKEWMLEHPLVGRKSEMNILHQYSCMSRHHSMNVMSVWGIVGVGKSALVKTFFCHKILSEGRLFEKYGWVNVSHPFDLREFSRSLILNFHSKSLEGKATPHYDIWKIRNPIIECQRILKQHMCLVVIDGLQSKKEWDMIQAELVSGSSSNSVIVITTEASIGQHCSEDRGELVLNVKCLQAKEAFELSKMEVYTEDPIQGEVADLQELTAKCGGFPKVIVEIAHLLGTRSAGRMYSAISLNGNFMHDLKTNRESDSLEGLLGWIRTYISTCPDSLKPCIFYLPIFPRGHIIRRRRLVRRWIAEGYSRDSYEESAEDSGEKNFSKLHDMSILQQPAQNTVIGDTRMVVCQVNGFMQEYIVSQQMEENLVFELAGSCTVTTQRTGRHLSILEHWVRDKTVFSSIDFSRLRSLTVFGKWESFFISKNMKLLRVLDLEDASGVNDADLENMVKLLGRLKFLSLRGCRNIFHLPSSLGDLRQLQTMDVRNTSIVTLPENIIKLQKLQYIRAGMSTRKTAASAQPVSSSWLPKFCKRRQLVGVVLPEGMGKLTVLHTLGVVNLAASGSNAVLEDLKELTQLRKLGVSGVNRKNRKDLISVISGNAHLETLSVQLNKDSKDCLDGISLPFENLRSLTLYGLGDKLPKGTNQLSALVKVDLEMATLTGNDIKFLGELPQLRILSVKQLQNGEIYFCVTENGEEEESYQKVKVLQVACGCSSSSLHVRFGEETMKKLELLKIDCYNGSSSYKFSGFENLRDLKQVLLLNASSTETLKEELERKLAEHPNSLKPVVEMEPPLRSF